MGSAVSPSRSQSEIEGRRTSGAAPLGLERAGRPTAHRGTFRAWLVRVRRNKKALLGSVMLLVLIVLAALAPVLAPYDPNQLSVGPRLAAPNGDHLLGTDAFGRDAFSRLLYGARIAVFVAFGVVAGSLAIGVTIGLAAGYIGRLLDTVAMGLLDIILTFPWTLMALAVAAILGPGLRTVFVALVVVYSPILARLTRAVVLSLREMEYVLAARVVGQTGPRIVWRCILPNSSSPIIVQATSIMGFSILAEAAVSYVGLGTQPPTPSWGLTLSDGADYMFVAPHLVIYPGLAIAYVVLALNLLGDGLRDILDPKLRT